MKQSLPIDLITINCTNPEAGLKVLEYCSSLFEFNDTFILSDKKLKSDNVTSIKIKKLKSIHEYNNFLLKIGNYTKSDHVLVVQEDGFIINKDKWDESFLLYDYIGAPWPVDEKWFKAASDSNTYNLFSESIKKNRIGNGGFSLRSKKFLEYSNKFDNCLGWGEDFFLCSLNYESAVKNNINFPNFKLALQFSYENGLKGFKKKKWKLKRDTKLNKNKHFGWHGKQVNNFKELQNIAYQTYN